MPVHGLKAWILVSMLHVPICTTIATDTNLLADVFNGFREMKPTTSNTYQFMLTWVHCGIMGAKFFSGGSN